MCEYQKLLADGKVIFNFHPDEEFESIDQVLRAAYKNIHHSGGQQFYIWGAAKFAEHLAWYADQTQSTKRVANDAEI